MSSPTKPRPAREPARAHRRQHNRHWPESPATACIIGPTRAPAARARGAATPLRTGPSPWPALNPGEMPATASKMRAHELAATRHRPGGLGVVASPHDYDNVSPTRQSRTPRRGRRPTGLARGPRAATADGAETPHHLAGSLALGSESSPLRGAHPASSKVFGLSPIPGPSTQAPSTSTPHRTGPATSQNRAPRGTSRIARRACFPSPQTRSRRRAAFTEHVCDKRGGRELAPNSEAPEYPEKALKCCVVAYRAHLV